jgi:hypothetical protein
MARYTLFVMLVIGSAATALAAIAPQDPMIAAGKNLTVIEKNQAFPVIGPIVVEDCVTEDCAGESV